MFKTNTAEAAPTTGNEKWKAKGFINIYLPTENGGRRKLGAIALKGDKANEARLLEWLEQDPSRVSQIAAKLSMEYQSAVPAEGTGFALGE